MKKFILALPFLLLIIAACSAASPVAQGTDKAVVDMWESPKISFGGPTIWVSPAYNLTCVEIGSHAAISCVPSSTLIIK